MRLSSNIIGNSYDETNFLHKLLLTDRQVANLRKVFTNNSSTDIKLSKTQLSKGNGVAVLQNEQLAEELHKPVIKKFFKRRVYSSFKDIFMSCSIKRLLMHFKTY